MIHISVVVLVVALCGFVAICSRRDAAEAVGSKRLSNSFAFLVCLHVNATSCHGLSSALSFATAQFGTEFLGPLDLGGLCLSAVYALFQQAGPDNFV